MPYQGVVPRPTNLGRLNEPIPLGCRVLTSGEAHTALAALPVGRTPRFLEMVGTKRVGNVVHPFDQHGWRLESFIADEVMRCREGRLFERPDDSDLYALLYERTAPIASLIQIGIDLPGE